MSVSASTLRSCWNKLVFGVAECCPPLYGKSNMQNCSTDIQNQVIGLVKSILIQNAITAEVNAESRLVDVGLNSVDMVNLMLSIEAEFDFTIPQGEITPENFQSVRTLQQMITAQLGPGIRSS